ncbi:ankyrin [Cristinia sonorae]|uniref:Ankyrin n=1 Tax=Cristinia sonorae TaxID=1940300 RepID=A0A8K0UMD4_9AGAR|nr:ankyrin [Cristinia sonorae]
MTSLAATLSSSSYSILHRDRTHVERAAPVSLLDAALNANELAVAQALSAGADVNQCDALGRTVVGCAIGGERWDEVDVSDASFMIQKRLRILKMILDHDETSLHALNAPQRAIRGVTPLGFAAWLNIPSAVRLMLETYPGLVSVDGMDSLGATALMYAARDGNVQVVQHLLMNGARADFRDIHHRTSIQHALRHPQVLWLCESALRRQRAQRNLVRGNEKNLVDLRTQLDEELLSVPQAVCHPRLNQKSASQDIHETTHALISATTVGNVQHLYTLLFSSASLASVSPSLPAILVNHPDSRGWSPIHYCVSIPDPSRAVLDLLYRAGADMSLYTSSGHGTPLHCLARTARANVPATIRSFIRHLVDDLRAPLAAIDHNKETCIHVAAEHGESTEVLCALLACDPLGTVREMRNARGLTALEVAKPTFRVAFGLAVDPLPRSSSALSVRTIKPSTTSMRSDSSLASLVAEKCRRQRSAAHSTGSSVASSVDASTLSLRILDNLRCISSQLAGDADFVDPTSVVGLLRDTSIMSEDLLAQMHTRANDAAEELGSAREKFKQLDLLLEDVTRLVEVTYGERLEEIERNWDAPDSVRRRTTDSGDSDSTVVSVDSLLVGPPTSENVKFAASLVTPTPSHTLTARGHRSAPQSGTSSPRFLDVSHMEFGYRSTPSITLPSEDHKPSGGKFLSPFSQGGYSQHKKSKNTSLRAAKSVEDLKGRQVHMDGELEKKDISMSRLKAWFKKKLAPETHEEESPFTSNPGAKVVRRESRIYQVTRPRPSSFIFTPVPPSEPIPAVPEDRARKLALSAARRIISTSSKDLVRIAECMNSADHFISLANRSISQVERIISRSLAQRETSLDRVRLMQQMNDLQYSLQDVVLASPEDSSDLSSSPPHFLPITIPSSPRHSQLVFPRPPGPPTLSTKSSMSSLSSTLIDGDDEDTRALRRLLTRKIDERTQAALDEIEKVSHWLRVVKDVLLGLRKRTHQL